MAKQEPQQPFFIPRVAGVTPPPPKPQPPPQLKSEVQAPTEAVFRPNVATPPPQFKPVVQAPAEAMLQPTVAAPSPQLKPEVPSAGAAAFQPTVAAPPSQLKPVVPSAGAAVFQPTVATPPPQLKPVIPSAGAAVFQPTVAAPPPLLKPEVQAPAEAMFEPTVAAPPPQLKPEVQAPAEATFQPTVVAPPPQVSPVVPPSADEAMLQPTVAVRPPQLQPVVHPPAEATSQPTVAAPPPLSQPPPQMKREVQAPAEAVFQSTAAESPVSASPVPPLTAIHPPVAAPPSPQIGRTPFPVPPKSNGGKGVLITVLAGLFLCVVLVAVVALTPSLRQKVQELASPQKSGTNVEVAGSSSSPSHSAPQSPPVYPEGASRVEENEIGFSFAVPQGYLAASEKEPDNLYLFERKLFTEPKRTVVIKKVSGDHPQGTGTGADLSSLLGGHAVSTVTFDWRGRALEGARSLDPNPATPIAVFTVVIPLRDQRVLLEVGGAVESEAVIREVMDQVLASLAEESK